mgnify:CR=1 FL=1
MDRVEVRPIARHDLRDVVVAIALSTDDEGVVVAEQPPALHRDPRGLCEQRDHEGHLQGRPQEARSRSVLCGVAEARGDLPLSVVVVGMAPRDEAMLVDMLRTAIAHDGPVGLRYPRGEAEGVRLPADPEEIEIGTGEVLREGKRVAIVGYGSGVPKALQAAELLAVRGLDVTVADARFAKPIDAALMAQLAAEHELLVTVEEGVLAGGFGSAVWETLNDGGLPMPRILRVGVPDRFVTHGKPALLHEEIGFTGPAIAERIAAAVGLEAPAPAS